MLSTANFKSLVKTVDDFHFYVSGGDRVFLLGLGRQNVWMWDGVAMMSGGPKWTKPVLNDYFFKLELPRKTLILAGMLL